MVPLQNAEAAGTAGSPGLSLCRNAASLGRLAALCGSVPTCCSGPSPEAHHCRVSSTTALRVTALAVCSGSIVALCKSVRRRVGVWRPKAHPGHVVTPRSKWKGQAFFPFMWGPGRVRAGGRGLAFPPEEVTFSSIFLQLSSTYFKDGIWGKTEGRGSPDVFSRRR